MCCDNRVNQKGKRTNFLFGEIRVVICHCDCADVQRGLINFVIVLYSDLAEFYKPDLA